jgi:predicted amidohydrolase
MNRSMSPPVSPKNVIASVTAKPTQIIDCKSRLASGCRADELITDEKIGPIPIADPNAASPSESPSLSTTVSAPSGVEVADRGTDTNRSSLQSSGGQGPFATRMGGGAHMHAAWLASA